MVRLLTAAAASVLIAGTGRGGTPVTVGATCSEGTSHVAMQLDLATTTTAPPKAGDPVRLTLNDSY